MSPACTCYSTLQWSCVSDHFRADRVIGDLLYGLNLNYGSKWNSCPFFWISQVIRPTLVFRCPFELVFVMVHVTRPWLSQVSCCWHWGGEGECVWGSGVTPDCVYHVNHGEPLRYMQKYQNDVLGAVGEDGISRWLRLHPGVRREGDGEENVLGLLWFWLVQHNLTPTELPVNDSNFITIQRAV